MLITHRITYLHALERKEKSGPCFLKMHASNLFFVASVYVQLDLMRVKTRKQGAWERG